MQQHDKNKQNKYRDTELWFKSVHPIKIDFLVGLDLRSVFLTCPQSHSPTEPFLLTSYLLVQEIRRRKNSTSNSSPNNVFRFNALPAFYMCSPHHHGVDWFVVVTCQCWSASDHTSPPPVFSLLSREVDEIFSSFSVTAWRQELL